MNRILIDAGELGAGDQVTLTDRRAVHLIRVLGVAPGRRLCMGILDGPLGEGEVCDVTAGTVRLRWFSSGQCPPPPETDLILALPRPKVMKRLWAPLASMGVGRIVLTHAAAVERVYFDTHWLDPLHYQPLLREGLEQSGDTRMPTVTIVRRFRPFVEDDLPGWFPDAMRLLAHPGDRPLMDWRPIAAEARLLLAVGPEGGWSAFERQCLAERDFQRFSLGWRILRSDVACVALLAAAQALRAASIAQHPT